MELYDVTEWRTPLGVGLLFDLRGQMLNLVKTVWDNADGRFDAADTKLKCVEVETKLQHLDKKPAGKSCCYVVLGDLALRALQVQADDTGANLSTTVVCTIPVQFVNENPDPDIAVLMSDYLLLALTGLRVSVEETMELRHFKPTGVSTLTNVGTEGSPIFRSVVTFSLEAQIGMRGRRESLVLRRVNGVEDLQPEPHT